MANNNGLNVLDAVTAAKLGKGTGGSGGVTKKYVDDGLALKQDKTMSASVTIGAETETTVEGAIGELADLVPSTAAPATNKLATAGDVNGEEITVTASTSPVSTASGNPRKITIHGKSEVVDGDIHSAGEGWATVDMGTMDWERQETQQSGIYRFKGTALSPLCIYNDETIQGVCARYQVDALNNLYYGQADNLRLGASNNRVYIRDDDYTDAATFKAAMSGVLLAYQLADPTQGNTIAIKTDDGTGIDGTMATFTTGTPLYGVSDTIRDVMEWDGSSGEVTKNCGDVDLSQLTWTAAGSNVFFSANNIGASDNYGITSICAKYTCVDNVPSAAALTGNKTLAFKNRDAGVADPRLYVKDTDYTDATTFANSLSGVHLVYELATPTTEQFTASENNSFAALQTYSPQTAIAVNDNPEFEVEAYAGTANGRAINSLNENLNNKIDDKITVSSTLTLAANAWSNNTQTVTFAHDTSRRNVIDIDTVSLQSWAAAGVYAVSETASGITFECSAIPETALTFKVTSMEVS